MTMMACGTLLRPPPLPQSHFSPLSSQRFHHHPRRLSSGITRVRRPALLSPVSCSTASDTPSPTPQDDQDPPQEAVLKAISEVSKSEGRVAQTTNVVIGGTVASDSTNEWLALDQKVNSYPSDRGFTVIGSGGDDFVQSMVVAVESVLREPIPEGRISRKLSSRGKYVSVNIGPVRVVSSQTGPGNLPGNEERREDEVLFVDNLIASSCYFCTNNIAYVSIFQNFCKVSPQIVDGFNIVSRATLFTNMVSSS